MAAAAEQVNCSYPIQIIDENGEFNANIGQYLNLGNDNDRIAAVSIFGPQNGGKSTLMNNCFSADFKVMNARAGIHATTRGIWIAKWTSSNCRNKILIVDTEGSDGSEREGDDRFEKQSAVFVLSISTMVIFNMECRDVDKYQAASLPLLQTVVEVMVRKFKTPRKVNILFVLRDKNDSPPEKLKEQLIVRMHKMWNETIKPQVRANGNANAALEDYFNIAVMAMPHYKYEKEEFIKEVANLRERIIWQSTSDRLGIPASGFVDYARKNWDEIKEEKILNLQLNMITIVEVYCHRIAEENYNHFCENESWLQIKRDVDSRVIERGFGNNVTSLIDDYLSDYDYRTQGFHETKREASRSKLTVRLLQLVEPTHLSLVQLMRMATLENFQKAAIDELDRTRAVEVVVTQMPRFISEFRNQLPDAAVGQAIWSTHTSSEISKLELEMASFIGGVRAMNKKLEQEKRDKKGFWSKIAKHWTKMAIVCSKTVVQVLLPGLDSNQITSTFEKLYLEYHEDEVGRN